MNVYNNQNKWIGLRFLLWSWVLFCLSLGESFIGFFTDCWFSVATVLVSPEPGLPRVHPCHYLNHTLPRHAAKRCIIIVGRLTEFLETFSVFLKYGREIMEEFLHIDGTLQSNVCQISGIFHRFHLCFRCDLFTEHTISCSILQTTLLVVSLSTNRQGMQINLTNWYETVNIISNVLVTVKLTSDHHNNYC